MNPTAIFSKTGKGVQEASGKTSALSRADRAVLKEIDGKTALANIAVKFEKIPADKFDVLIQQFDKDGYIREVSSGSQAAAAPPARSAAPAKAAPPPADSGSDEALDFTQSVKLPPKAPPPAAAPKPPPVDLAAAARAEAERNAKEQQAFDYKARAEAEAKVKAEADAKVKTAREAAVRMATEANAKAGAADRERQAAEERARKGAEDNARLERELNAKLAEERKAREDAERRAGEATELARRELEEKAKRDAEELRQRLEAEMKVKLEEERKAREADDRKRREEEDRTRAEEDRKRREEDGRRRKEDEERRAKEAAERKAREEEDRKQREEDDRHRKEDEERRAKEVAERRARKEEEERRAKEEADRRKQDEERRAKEEADRRAKEEAERRAREEQDRRRRKEEDDRRAKEEAERKAKEEAEVKARSTQSASISAIAPALPPAPPPAAGGGLDDSLLADLDSFGQREEEEQKAKEEAERKAKEAAARKAKEAAERRAKDDAERRAKEEAEKKRHEEEERKAKEEAEQRAREEEERQKQEEAERKAARGAAAAKDAGKGDDDIGVTDDDLGMDDVKKDEKALSATARKAAREREQAPAAAVAARRPRKWGKPAAIALFVLLVGGVGALHVMPVSTAEYEKAASDAMGVPVKIASARLSVITGIEVKFEGVSIGDTVNIKLVRGYPEVGSLFGSKKSFSRIELEGVSLSQSQLADAVLGKVSGENFRVGRVVIKQAKLDGPLALPALDVDATVAGDGSLQSVSLRGGDKLSVQLSPKGNDIGFEISAGSLALPFVPALSLSDFGMKGTANRGGVTMSEFDGRAFDGVISGSAKIRWGANWLVDGEVRARGVKVAVIAPALVSEGKLDGRGTYTMSGPNPATLFQSARVQAEFKIEKGVLGSFDLTRALQTGGAQTGGRTPFTELTGQAVYDKGTVKVSNVAIAGAGGMNAGASLEVDANGALSGRIVADVKTPNQTLRATLNVSGKIQDPVIRK